MSDYYLWQLLFIFKKVDNYGRFEISIRCTMRNINHPLLTNK